MNRRRIIVINPAAMFLVKVTTPKTMAPNNKILGKIKTKYVVRYACKLNAVTISEFVPGKRNPIKRANPIAITIQVTTITPLKNLANK
ncbi:hypothetical protein GCM10022260_21800 [Gaetbulibacter aestuarii]